MAHKVLRQQARLLLDTWQGLCAHTTQQIQEVWDATRDGTNMDRWLRDLLNARQAREFRRLPGLPSLTRLPEWMRPKKDEGRG